MIIDNKILSEMRTHPIIYQVDSFHPGREYSFGIFKEVLSELEIRESTIITDIEDIKFLIDSVFKIVGKKHKLKKLKVNFLKIEENIWNYYRFYELSYLDSESRLNRDTIKVGVRIQYNDMYSFMNEFNDKDGKLDDPLRHSIPSNQNYMSNQITLI